MKPLKVEAVKLFTQDKRSFARKVERRHLAIKYFRTAL